MNIFNLPKIDWSKAPNGTTHRYICKTSNTEFWEKHINGEVFFYRVDDHRWVYHTSNILNVNMSKRFEKTNLGEVK